MLTINITKREPNKDATVPDQEIIKTTIECDVVEERHDVVYFRDLDVAEKRESMKDRFIIAYVMNDKGATVKTIYGKQPSEIFSEVA